MANFKKPVTEDDRAIQQQQMERAAGFALEITLEADIRDLSHADLLISLCSTFAACNPQLTGEVMGAVMDSIRMQPITKIIQPDQALQ